MNHDSKRPVTLEDILRLKRAERPAAEFWDQFDRELRAKQLSALVEKRPWWRTFSFQPVFAGMRRFHLPLGAAAVLAVTIFSVREYRSTAPSAVPATGGVAVAHLAQPEQPGVAVAVNASASSVAVDESADEPTSSVAEVAAPAASQFVLSSDATPSGGLVQIIPGVGASAGLEEHAANIAPTTRLVADNFGSMSTAEASQFLTPARGFETRGLPARSKPVEPLSQMKVPTGSRRSYLIASATLASSTTPPLTSDRSARGLSDERLYDTISRVNARGDRVLLKF